MQWKNAKNLKVSWSQSYKNVISKASEIKFFFRCHQHQITPTHNSATPDVQDQGKAKVSQQQTNKQTNKAQKAAINE